IGTIKSAAANIDRSLGTAEGANRRKHAAAGSASHRAAGLNKRAGAAASHDEPLTGSNRAARHIYHAISPSTDPKFPRCVKRSVLQIHRAGAGLSHTYGNSPAGSSR